MLLSQHHSQSAIHWPGQRQCPDTYNEGETIHVYTSIHLCTHTDRKFNAYKKEESMHKRITNVFCWMCMHMHIYTIQTCMHTNTCTHSISSHVSRCVPQPDKIFHGANTSIMPCRWNQSSMIALSGLSPYDSPVRVIPIWAQHLTWDCPYSKQSRRGLLPVHISWAAGRTSWLVHWF